MLHSWMTPPAGYSVAVNASNFDPNVIVSDDSYILQNSWTDA